MPAEQSYRVTSATRVAAAASRGACNAVLLKPNQAGTVTETKAALAAAHTARWQTVLRIQTALGPAASFAGWRRK